jgi:hypothetical protein
LSIHVSTGTDAVGCIYINPVNPPPSDRANRARMGRLEKLSFMKVAVLDPAIAAQITARSSEIRDFELAFSNQKLTSFKNQLREHPVDALVVNLGFLGDDPQKTVEELHEVSNGALVLIVYMYARRELIARLKNQWMNATPGPVRVSWLETLLNNLRRQAKALQPAKASPRLYDDEQLGRLREITSSVQCECPNHLASINASLYAFEDYSRDCENRNAKDAEVHGMLYRKTAEARVIMDDALKQLCEHENIQL